MSFRAHFRHAQPSDSVRERSKQSSRIPTKPGNTENSKQEKGGQNVSKFVKRVSVSGTPASDSIKQRSAPTSMPTRATTVAPTLTESNQKLAALPPPSAALTLSPYDKALSPPPILRTPSLVSGGSSVSTFDSPRSNTLRRKHSGAIDKYAAQKRASSTGRESDRGASQGGQEMYREEFDNSVLGISLPATSAYDDKDMSTGLNQGLYGGDQGALARNITSPVTGYAPSATPSTRYTDSPFSHVPTPSSTSSYSPAVAVTSGHSTLQRQVSPTQTRPPVTRRTPSKQDASRLGLPPVREASTSSSNSTARAPTAKTNQPKELQRKASTGRLKTKGSEPSKPQTRNKLTKGQPPSTASKRPVQVPPELAHLNVDVKSQAATQKPQPPARPSRNGTPNIGDMNGPSPIVQSDLPRLYTTYHKRTPSQETPVSATTSPSPKARFGFSPKVPSQNPSPRIDSAVSPSLSTRKYARRPTTEVPAPEAVAELQRKDSPLVTASSSTKAPRFGLFSRKPKPDASKVVEKPKRPPAKGPAAGTGHEGYGRFGFRGRSGSGTSSAGFRSPSSDSSTSSFQRPTASRKNSTGSKDGSDLDDFLKERLNPVVLRGIGGAPSPAGSSPELPGVGLNIASSSSTSLDSYQKPQLLPSAMQKSTGASPQKRPVTRRKPSDSSEDEGSDIYPSSTARQPVSRLPQGNIKPPQPVFYRNKPEIVSKSLPSSSYENKTIASLHADPKYAENNTLEGNEGLWLRSNGIKSSKPDQKRNFFQRIQSSPRSKGKERAIEAADTFDAVQNNGSQGVVAHYAMPYPAGVVTVDEMERILQESEASLEESMSESNAPSKVVPYERRHKSLLPSPPKHMYSNGSDFSDTLLPPRPIVPRLDSTESAELLSAQTALPRQTAHVVEIPRSPQAMLLHSPNPGSAQFHTPEMGPETDSPLLYQDYATPPEQANGGNSPRQPRLSPVGRIPRVVSRRDRDRKLPDNSFSRPFVRSQPRPSVKPPGSVYSQIREMASPIEAYPQMMANPGVRPDENLSTPKNQGFYTNRESANLQSANEFLAFLPRNNSDQSYSSSSRDPSWMNINYAQQPYQDDVWNEYNDFMDEVIPLRTATSSSSFRAPFQYTHALYDTPRAARYIPSMMGQPPSSELPLIPGATATANVLTVGQQVARFLQPSMSPIEPQAPSHFWNGYQSGMNTAYSQYRNSFVNPRYSDWQPSALSSIPSARGSVVSSRYSRASSHSRSASLPETNARNSQTSLALSGRFNRDTQLKNIAEIGSVEQNIGADLRLPALMTSKWLSFGRVLFSPAHHETQLSEEPRVLVVDGLSNDWSYYVALSYPAATVYNLTPDTTKSTWPEINRQPPSNHRQIPHSSISAAFPFPKGFFTTVVLRFPKATTDQAYQACIYECKRVLRPGGYLEVAVLDLDLNNMGNKARRAVRGLKTRMQQRDENVCLSNLSDVVVRLIGRRGFEGVQRCIVGVPAAGNIPHSQDMSSSSSGTSGKPGVWRREDQSDSDFQFSFTDLLDDARNSQIGPAGNGPGNDEKITKMVAKVGRWWYSSCYEKSLVPTDRSIWSDHGLLRECERQGTSFRLLICHAQKPTQTRRRTVSV